MMKALLHKGFTGPAPKKMVYFNSINPLKSLLGADFTCFSHIDKTDIFFAGIKKQLNLPPSLKSHKKANHEQSRIDH